MTALRYEAVNVSELCSEYLFFHDAVLADLDIRCEDKILAGGGVEVTGAVNLKLVLIGAAKRGAPTNYRTAVMYFERVTDVYVDLRSIVDAEWSVRRLYTEAAPNGAAGNRFVVKCEFDRRGARRVDVSFLARTLDFRDEGLAFAKRVE